MRRARCARAPTPDELNEQGTDLAERGDLEAATRAFREAAAAGSQDATINLGQALRGLGRSGEAAAILRDAASAEALVRLGDVLSEDLGDIPGAREAYARAAEAGDLDEAWHLLGELLEKVGRDAEAVDAFRRAVELNGPPADAP